MRIYNGFSVSNGIVYGKVVTLFYEKNFIQTLIQHIRYYMLQENEFYSFSELQQFEQK